MTVSTAERRRSKRVAASHPAVILSRSGRILARGLTGNISATGALIIVRIKKGLFKEDQVILELTVPAVRQNAGRRERTRSVRLSSRIIRTINLGYLVGIGIEFLEEQPPLQPDST